MTNDKFNRLKALLLLNSYLLMRQSMPGEQHPQIWQAVAEDYEQLKKWLEEHDDITPQEYPRELPFPSYL